MNKRKLFHLLVVVCFFNTLIFEYFALNPSFGAGLKLEIESKKEFIDGEPLIISTRLINTDDEQIKALQPSFLHLITKFDVKPIQYHNGTTIMRLFELWQPPYITDDLSQTIKPGEASIIENDLRLRYPNGLTVGLYSVTAFYDTTIMIDMYSLNNSISKDKIESNTIQISVVQPIRYEPCYRILSENGKQKDHSFNPNIQKLKSVLHDFPDFPFNNLIYWYIAQKTENPAEQKNLLEEARTKFGPDDHWVIRIAADFAYREKIKRDQKERDQFDLEIKKARIDPLNKEIAAEYDKIIKTEFPQRMADMKAFTRKYPNSLFSLDFLYMMYLGPWANSNDEEKQELEKTILSRFSNSYPARQIQKQKSLYTIGD